MTTNTNPLTGEQQQAKTYDPHPFEPGDVIALRLSTEDAPMVNAIQAQLKNIGFDYSGSGVIRSSLRAYLLLMEQHKINVMLDKETNPP